jgi:hypothetical protein
MAKGGAKRKAAKRKATRRKAVTARRKVGRSRSLGRKSAKKAATRKTASARKKAMKKVAKKRATVVAKARKRRVPVARKAAAKKTVAKKTAAKKAVARKPAVPVRTAPGLNRERRTIRDDDIVQTPPSSLDFDRSASAARSGRRELRERYEEHTETSPAMTGGDVDADWESAYSVGDEAPGGDNPTPDQDLVDDIGRAVGIEYQDNEELKGEAKVSKRDRNRWELDPASSDDWDER